MIMIRLSGGGAGAMIAERLRRQAQACAEAAKLMSSFADRDDMLRRQRTLEQMADEDDARRIILVSAIP